MLSTEVCNGSKSKLKRKLVSTSQGSFHRCLAYVGIFASNAIEKPEGTTQPHCASLLYDHAHTLCEYDGAILPGLTWKVFFDRPSWFYGQPFLSVIHNKDLELMNFHTWTNYFCLGQICVSWKVWMFLQRLAKFFSRLPLRVFLLEWKLVQEWYLVKLGPNLFPAYFEENFSFNRLCKHVHITHVSTKLDKFLLFSNYAFESDCRVPKSSVSPMLASTSKTLVSLVSTFCN